MTLCERPGQQAPFMQETFLCTQTKAVKVQTQLHTPFLTHAEMRNMDALSAGVKRSLWGKEYKKLL